MSDRRSGRAAHRALEPRSAGRRPRAAAPSSAAARFRAVDPYRAAREWRRYEGTAQRDLWRTLRERFLARHASEAGWVLDLGSGPGRFTPHVGAARSRRVALDLSHEMLGQLTSHWPEHSGGRAVPDRVQGDGGRPPFLPKAFGEVVLLGNALGFAGPESDRLWEASRELVRPGGTLVVEIAPGPGEVSRYLHRLPASSVARLLRAPVAAVAPRIEREGFATEPVRRKVAGEFRRWTVSDLAGSLESHGWSVAETRAVAPVLGSEASRIEAAARDPKAWAHLLEIEERFGRAPARWEDAAAVLLAATRPLLETRD